VHRCSARHNGKGPEGGVRGGTVGFPPQIPAWWRAWPGNEVWGGCQRHGRGGGAEPGDRGPARGFAALGRRARFSRDGGFRGRARGRQAQAASRGGDGPPRIGRGGPQT